MTTTATPLLRPERALLHPLWLAALALLLLNDHVLKGAGVLPALVTGKLSDVAGMLVAPALLAVLLRARGRGVVLGAHLAVGLGFAAIKLSAAAAAGFEALMALTPFPWHITVDPTDLVALPALLLSWRVSLGAMARPVAVARPLAGALLGVGLFASLATSPPPDEGGFPSLRAHLVIGAASDETLILRVRPLRDSVYLDCTTVFRSPSTTLSRDLFGPATAWQVEPGRAVPALGDGETTPTGECHAALVDGTVHRGAGEGMPIPMALLFWRSIDFPLDDISSNVADVVDDRLVRIDVGQSGARWTAHEALFPAPLELDAEPVPGCEPAPEGGFIDWQLPLPTGTRKIAAVESAPDGCHRVTFDAGDVSPGGGAASWYVCSDTPFPFAAGDELSVSSGVRGVAGRALDGVALVGRGDAVMKRLLVGRGDDLVDFAEGADWSARDLRECSPARGPCGSLVVPQELDVRGPDREAHLGLGTGDALDIEGGTLVVARAERIPVGDSECLSDMEGPLFLESVFVSPRIAE